jgi:hypothetical protein
LDSDFSDPETSDDELPYPQLEDPSGRLIRLGGRLQSYDPTKVSNLLLRFVDVRTPRQLLRFVDLYGPLTVEGFVSERGESFYDTRGETLWAPEEGEQLALGLEEADWFRHLVKNKTQPSVLAIAIKRYRSAYRFEIVPDKRKGLRVVALPQSLLDLLRLRLVQLLMGSTSYFMCGWCHKMFARGVDTGRRADAEFCCDEHRIKSNSRKRSL